MVLFQKKRNQEAFVSSARLVPGLDWGFRYDSGTIKAWLGAEGV
jgi:hypothetical protein